MTNHTTTETDKLVGLIEYRQPLFDAWGKSTGHRLDNWNVFADPSGMVSAVAVNGSEELYASVAAVVRYIERCGFTVTAVIDAQTFA